ncbi:FecCD family ABC transporter permease [Marinilactibacillus kalidii]|uniref:FecCD family ABC transporter permease n=1 Tax=Marinilactibacillus kalidii TaxID=2820274 RepID=UPI001ABDEEB2|nr:iron ABC transporter permease [Marinilactibacillus kalidii]
MNTNKIIVKNVSYLLFSLLTLILLMSLISLATGHLALTPSDIIKTVLGEGSKRNELLLFEFRLPRLAIAILAGAALAVAGTLFQGVTQNELADPGMMGINAGAGFFIVLYLTFRAQGTRSDGLWQMMTLPIAAFLGGLAAAVCIYAVAWKKGITPIRMILVGIGVNAGFGALLTILQLRMDQRAFNQVTIWLSGSIWNASWTAVGSLLFWTLILLPFSLYKAKTLNFLQLGDEMATGLGFHVEKERIKLVAIGVALAGASVSVAGGIAFLGLGAPHIARKIVGNKHQRLIPTAACMGSLILLLADMMARNIFSPTEVPVGLIVAVLGAPYFIYLLITTEA